MIPWSAAVSIFRDREVFERNCQCSEALRFATTLHIKEGVESVARAYNAAIDESSDDILAFVHPDVYLPAPWAGALQDSLKWLETHDPNWGVLGLVGCNRSGGIVGFAYSTGWGRFIGCPFDVPTPVRTVDEFVFIIRKSSGIRFDEALPGAQSQLCATDVCLQAEQRGLSVYAVPCFSFHNSNGWSSLPHGFWKPYLYMRKKWWNALPIHVPYARLTKLCLPMIRNSVRYQMGGGRRGFRKETRVGAAMNLRAAERDLGPIDPCSWADSDGCEPEEMAQASA
jgi:hypothetical protein